VSATRRRTPPALQPTRTATASSPPTPTMLATMPLLTAGCWFVCLHENHDSDAENGVRHSLPTSRDADTNVRPRLVVTRPSCSVPSGCCVVFRPFQCRVESCSQWTLVHGPPHRTVSTPSPGTSIYSRSLPGSLNAGAPTGTPETAAGGGVSNGAPDESGEAGAYTRPLLSST